MSRLKQTGSERYNRRMRILLPMLLLLLLAARILRCDEGRPDRKCGQSGAGQRPPHVVLQVRGLVPRVQPLFSITGEVYKPEDVAAVAEIAKGVAGVRLS